MRGCFLTSTPAADASALSRINLAASPNEWSIKSVTASEDASSSKSSAELLETLKGKLAKNGRQGNASQSASSKWFEIPKVSITPEIKSEITALRLKAFMDPKKFYKSSDMKKIPERFHMGVMVEGGLRAVGGGQESQAAGTSNRSGAKGKSLLQEALGDEGVQAWTKKRFTTVHTRQLKAAALGKKLGGKTKKVGRR